MLDRDLAELYGVHAIRLREQVKRNKERFPDNFMFQLNEQEVEAMVSQNAIPSKKHLGGYYPYAFTEHGVTMLANLLKSNTAINMSIAVVRAFIMLRQLSISYKEISDRIKKLERKYNRQFKDVYEVLQLLMEEKHLNEQMKENWNKRERIAFKK